MKHGRKKNIFIKKQKEKWTKNAKKKTGENFEKVTRGAKLKYTNLNFELA